MESNIQFIATSPEQLRADIVEDITQRLAGMVKKTEDPEQLLTREEAAQFLKINLTTLNVWTKAKKLKSYGIGNRVYYKKSELMNSLVPLNK